MGDIYHAGSDHVLMVSVIVEINKQLSEVGGIDSAVLVGQMKYLVTGVLDCSCLVAAYVTCRRGDNTLVVFEKGGDYNGIGLGSSREKFNIEVVSADCLFYLFLCAVAVSVTAVA